LHLV
jgi:enhancer of polycomb-like protein